MANKRRLHGLPGSYHHPRNGSNVAANIYSETVAYDVTYVGIYVLRGIGKLDYQSHTSEVRRRRTDRPFDRLFLRFDTVGVSWSSCKCATGIHDFS